MSELTLLGRGPSLAECPVPFVRETWVAASVLGVPEWAGYDYSKVFCFDVIENPTEKQARGVDVTKEKTGVGIARERRIPVVSTHDYATESYPISDIIRQFGTNYFLNDSSYMIAYALYLGYESLFLYGIDQTDGGYEKGRSYVAYWLGVATGMRTSVSITRGALPWFYKSSVGGY